MNPETLKVIGECIGAAAIAEGFLIYFSKTRGRILAFKFISDLLWFFNMLCLGNFTGAFCCSCRFAPSFLWDFLGQCNITEELEGKLFTAVHRDALDDFVKQPLVKLGGRLIFFEYAV